MSWRAVKAPPQEILIATNVAAGMMGGTESPLEHFCAGYATGIAAAFECLGLDAELLDPARLGEERGSKTLAGAVAVIKKHNEAFLRDAAYEELAGAGNNRKAFRESAREAFSSYESQTERVN